MKMLMERSAPPALLDDLPPSSGLAVRHWTPDEFRRMASAGLFGSDERLTLADGQIVGREMGLPRLLNRTEYYALAEHGILGPEERTELIYGRVIKRLSSMNRPQSIAIGKTAKALASVLGGGFAVEQQMPMRLDDGTETVPDMLVLAGQSDDYADVPAASDALLIVEVSDATLRYDRRTKARLYAAESIADYWLLNLNARTLEVRRQPEGGTYRSLTTYGDEEAVAPLSAPNAPVRVADLLRTCCRWCGPEQNNQENQG